MIKIMFADDNLFALKHYSRLVDWESYGFEVVAAAEDGLEAWKKFQKVRPDVVITDIKMPGMDGLELASRIKKARPAVTVIFLSSYNEFDYARTALKLNVDEYILKDELNSERMLKKLKEIKNSVKDRKRSLMEVQTVYLAKLLAGDNSDDDAKVKPAEDIPFGAVMIEQDHVPEKLIKYTNCQVESVKSAGIKDCIGGFFQEDFFVYHMDQYRWLCLCEKTAELKATAHQLKQLLNTTFSRTFSVFVIGSFDGLRECGAFYEEKIERYTDRRFFWQAGIVIDLYAELAEEKKTGIFVGEKTWRENTKAETTKTETARAEAYANELEQLSRAIESEDGRECRKVLDQVFLPLVAAADTKGFFTAAELVFGRLKKYGEHCVPDSAFGNAKEEPAMLLTATDALKWMKNRAEYIAGVWKKQSYRRSEEMKRVIQFIYENYQDPLMSMERIAEVNGMSVNRLNHLFKKNCGETAGKYLTRVRMEKAGELLTKEKIKISDIPMMTGYSSPSYFSRAFLKYYGMTPTEYRLK